MPRNVTDRILLKAIHDTYYKKYCAIDDIENPDACTVYLPIDCQAIADKLKIDVNIVFGRLYYHLDKKYGYKRDNGALVPLFSLVAGHQRHVIHFPLLSAVVAELEQSYYRFTLPLFLSCFALMISVVGFIGVNT